MWASDSSITLAMSKLQFHDSHHQYFNSKGVVNNNHLAYRHHCPVHNRISICQHQHHPNLHINNIAKNTNIINSNNNNNSSNNLNNNSNTQKNNNLNNEKLQNDQSNSTDQQLQPAQTQTRIILPPQTRLDLSQVQIQPCLRATAKSLPSTPLTTKHISTKAYSDYENFLFI